MPQARLEPTVRLASLYEFGCRISELSHRGWVSPYSFIIFTFRDDTWQFYLNLAGSELPLVQMSQIEETLSKLSVNQVKVCRKQ